MNKKLSIFILAFSAFLLMQCCITLPSFAQQDFPKRVEVIVKMKEIKPTQEIVQIPADNIDPTLNHTNKTPQVASTRKKRNTENIFKNKTLPHSAVKNNATKPTAQLSASAGNEQKKQVIAPIKSEKKQPTLTQANNNATPKQSTIASQEKGINKQLQTIATNKPKAQNQEQKTAHQQVAVISQKPVVAEKSKTTSEIVKDKNSTNQTNTEHKATVNSTNVIAQNNTKPSNSHTNDSTTANNPTEKSKESINDFIDNHNVSVSDTNSNNPELDNYVKKENSFNYTWVGIFLVITGIVFGLLFGKVAFLISAVGIVFILISFLINR